jgi:glucose-6-phosphate 1-dehydrogenase
MIPVFLILQHSYNTDITKKNQYMQKNSEARGSDRLPEPCVMIIFGATGDLTRRKLIPALFHLYSLDKLPKEFSVLGVSRKDMSDDVFRDTMKEGVEEFGREKPDEKKWENFAKILFSRQIAYDDPDSYHALADALDAVAKERNASGNRLFYLALPPSAYGTVVHNIDEAGLNKPARENEWVRIIVEKPIGYDLDSAVALNDRIAEAFAEEQVYRIDHFLGKETVQNLLVFRFANGIFEPVWNRNYIDHVQITAAETVGVEDRGGYYEKSGALRDMIQNHLLQVLAHTAMEPPARFDAHAFRDEKVKVFHAVQPIRTEDVERQVVRAQYGKGSIDGRKVAAYRDEEGIDRKSTTETYVALKLIIDNWRWSGVPFYLRTGKRMAEQKSEVVLVFKRAPHRIFSHFDGLAESGLDANVLAIRIQPNEGISLRFGAKKPGPGMQVQPVDMDFNYDSSFGGRLSDAYERLLLDALIGDAALFARRDAVEASWKILDPILDVWERSRVRKLPHYEAGSCGPREADELLERNGCWWRE